MLLTQELELVAHAQRAAVAGSPLHEEVERYLAGCLAPARDVPAQTPQQAGPAEVAESVFRILSARRFSYLGRTRSLPYRDAILSRLECDIRGARPLGFYYDIGGGYHASVRGGAQDALGFDVGLGELFILAQIKAFEAEVRRSYAPGVRFCLVIDNLCAHFVNDVPLSRTGAYCRGLRQLIAELGLGQRVELLVESERVTLQAYREYVQGRDVAARLPPTASEVDNVSRFVGHACSALEASVRMARYHEVTTVSEACLEPLIDGVHMTQRATPTTFGFRPFPGGDSRIQCGEVMLTRNAKGRLHPLLVTTTNQRAYRYIELRLGDRFPSAVRVVTFAARLPQDREQDRSHERPA